jgi:ubiquinone/menaquinone biosynthesis C-methylase UbiE
MGYRFIDYLGWHNFKPKVDRLVLERIGIFKQAKDTVILELFCGKGELQKILKEAGYARVFGSDISLSELRQAHKDSCLQACDSLVTCYKPGSFDFVFINEGLHHLLGLGQMEKCFSEVRRILKDNGTFVFYEPSNTPVRKFFQFLLFSPLANLSRYTRKTRNELIKEMAEYTFWINNTRDALRLLQGAGFCIKKNRNTLMHMVVVLTAKDR